jgi:hypothetical protein
MHVGMGLIKNEHGVWCARVKVKKHLRAAVARVSDKRGKSRQTFLKQSLRTKDKAEAKRRLPAVLLEFNETLKKAEALIAPEPVLPLRTSLSKNEIERLAQEIYAKTLSDHERLRFGGRKVHAEIYELARREVEQEGRELGPPMFPLESIPEHGWSREQLELQREYLRQDLATMQEALAMGDITAVQDHMMPLLDENQINLDPQSDAYRELGRAVLRQYVRALQAIGQRNAGEPVETPASPRTKVQASTEGGTLRAAFDGWRKAQRPSTGTLTEYQRAVDMFIQLHGDVAIAEIKRSHARGFREALQEVPRIRSKNLQAMSLPELAAYGRDHQELEKVSEKTVNKQLGGVQAIVGPTGTKGWPWAARVSQGWLRAAQQPRLSGQPRHTARPTQRREPNAAQVADSATVGASAFASSGHAAAVAVGGNGLSAYSAAVAAFSINAATSGACERKIAWLPGSSMTCDCARFAMNRSRSGLIIRSCMATTA